MKNVKDVEEVKKNHITVSNNEWISNEIDLDWLQKCFKSESAKWQQEKFHLLIINEHVSYLTSEAIMFFFTFYWSASISECRSLSIIDHCLQAEAWSIYSIKCWIFNWQVKFHKIVSASLKDCFNDKQHTKCLSQIWSNVSRLYYCSIKAFYHHQISFYHFFRYHNSKFKWCIIFNIIHLI